MENKIRKRKKGNIKDRKGNKTRKANAARKFEKLRSSMVGKGYGGGWEERRVVLGGWVREKKGWNEDSLSLRGRQ